MLLSWMGHFLNVVALKSGKRRVFGFCVFRVSQHLSLAHTHTHKHTHTHIHTHTHYTPTLCLSLTIFLLHTCLSLTHVYLSHILYTLFLSVIHREREREREKNKDSLSLSHAHTLSNLLAHTLSHLYTHYILNT
jgi:hypothetical protein